MNKEKERIKKVWKKGRGKATDREKERRERKI